MRRNTPLITLLTGAALGVVLLIASMLSTPSKTPTGYTAAATPSASTTAPATPTPASSAPSTQPSIVPPPTTASPTPQGPTRVNYAGSVNGGASSIAVSVHNGQVIAYLCNGSVIESWLKGTANGGKLAMTGKNHATLTAKYSYGKVTGAVVADGTKYTFSVPAVHKPSGLWRATAEVRGAKIKAGWIVLADGSQVGSVEQNPDAAAPSATEAPRLDVATGTATFNGTVLHAVPVSGVTGSGF